MATRDTTTPAFTPPSPSPRADAAPWVSETPGRSPDVVGIVDRQRCPQHARKGKLKESGRASTAASVSSSSKKGSEDSGSTGPKKRAEGAGVETDPHAEEKAALPRAKRAKKSPDPAPSSTARTLAPAKTSEASCNDRGGFYLNKFMA
ncbi:hypothetical protein F444_03486, partial [Phytophthora nicotianae P1976]